MEHSKKYCKEKHRGHNLRTTRKISRLRSRSLMQDNLCVCMSEFIFAEGDLPFCLRITTVGVQ